jgi:hypothetical protein
MFKILPERLVSQSIFLHFVIVLTFFKYNEIITLRSFSFPQSLSSYTVLYIQEVKPHIKKFHGNSYQIFGTYSSSAFICIISQNRSACDEDELYESKHLACEWRFE